MKRSILFLMTLGIGMFFVLGGLIGCADTPQSPSSARSNTSKPGNDTGPTLEI